MCFCFYLFQTLYTCWQGEKETTTIIIRFELYSYLFHICPFASFFLFFYYQRYITHTKKPICNCVVSFFLFSLLALKMNHDHDHAAMLETTNQANHPTVGQGLHMMMMAVSISFAHYWLDICKVVFCRWHFMVVMKRRFYSKNGKRKLSVVGIRFSSCSRREICHYSFSICCFMACDLFSCCILWRFKNFSRCISTTWFMWRMFTNTRSSTNDVSWFCSIDSNNNNNQCFSNYFDCLNVKTILWFAHRMFIGMISHLHDRVTRI